MSTARAHADAPLAARDKRRGGQRRPRADAVRNRARLIAAAVDSFARHGFDVSVAEIARRAGVGPGTLFRNFATKEDLILAVFEVRVREAIEVAHAALEMDDPGEAFEWFHFQIAEMQLRDLGFFHAIRQRMFEHPEMVARKAEIETAVAEILSRAQRAGAVRGDVTIDDLRFMMMALAQGDKAIVGAVPGIHFRYLRVLLDGLKPAGASPLPK